LAEFTRQFANSDQYQITILESGKEPLVKVKISGGGRCNVTHACFEPSLLVQNYPRGSKELRGAFHVFQPQDTIAWFRAHRVPLKVEADGRIFPVTDDSQTIVDCLLETAISYGIELRLQTTCLKVDQQSDHLLLHLKSGEKIIADYLVLATGSHPLGYQIAKSLGHTIIDPVPSLFTFNIHDRALQSLMGLSVEKAIVKLKANGSSSRAQAGALLITHWGLSGPAILKLSAWSARELHAQRYQSGLIINWVGEQSADQVYGNLLTVKQNFPKKQIENYCPYPLPRRLWSYLLESSTIVKEKIWSEVSNKDLQKLAEALTHNSYTIAGKGAFKDEFVTCGGVKLKEVNFKNMSSRICPQLFFAGEILDIDGVTGGFNFQSAWTTAHLAAKGIVEMALGHNPHDGIC
jgi:predicted Rossmann fold flavoprotein